jgi:glycosyltransferase involved in cell wall biosynthesis
MTNAPIALFTFNRLDHTIKTLEALQRNELAYDSELFVFSDGPGSEADMEKVRALRNYLRTISGFSKVTIFERDKNFGLAESIITGVTEIINTYGLIIVLEDDMVTSPWFLRYMNDALELYRDEDRVISIHGYCYPVKAKLPETFFLKGADCWGWATWKRGWDLFEPDGEKLLNELRARKLNHSFDYDGTHEFSSLLEGQINGMNDSWAIRWYASAFLEEKLTLYPGRSLIHNIGIDDSGTHCAATDIFDTVVSSEPVRIDYLFIEENRAAREAFKKFFRSLKPSLCKRALVKISQMMSGNP